MQFIKEARPQRASNRVFSNKQNLLHLVWSCCKASLSLQLTVQWHLFSDVALFFAALDVRSRMGGASARSKHTKRPPSHFYQSFHSSLLRALIISGRKLEFAFGLVFSLTGKSVTARRPLSFGGCGSRSRLQWIPAPLFKRRTEFPAAFFYFSSPKHPPKPAHNLEFSEK